MNGCNSANPLLLGLSPKQQPTRRAASRLASRQAAVSAHRHGGDTGFCCSLERGSGFFRKEINEIIVTSKKNINPKQSKAKTVLIQQKDGRTVHNAF